MILRVTVSGVEYGRWLIRNSDFLLRLPESLALFSLFFLCPQLARAHFLCPTPPPTPHPSLPRAAISTMDRASGGLR